MCRKINVIIGITGSVAAIKVPEFIQKLKNSLLIENIDFELKIITTESSKHFINKFNLEVIGNDNEFKEWKSIGDEIMHISLRQWADIFIIIPLTAHTLAKLSNGICDNLLTNIARAWNFKKPIIVCPAMNNYMWEHPITSKQINQLESFGYKVIYPIKKKLACGEFGIGGLRELDEILKTLISTIKSSENAKE